MLGLRNNGSDQDKVQTRSSSGQPFRMPPTTSIVKHDGARWRILYWVGSLSDEQRSQAIGFVNAAVGAKFMTDMCDGYVWFGCMYVHEEREEWPWEIPDPGSP